MPKPTASRTPTVWLTSREAAEYARVSLSIISRAANDGRLSGVKLDPESPKSSWRFRTADVDAWLEQGRVNVA